MRDNELIFFFGLSIISMLERSEKGTFVFYNYYKINSCLLINNL